MSLTIDAPKPGEDHRVRVARAKRERMHAHLLRSVMAEAGRATPGRVPVIDDVIRHAEVSRGTFYKHFSSLEEAVAELGAQLADEMTFGIQAVYDTLSDPRDRTATGFQLFLRRGLADPVWAGFIAQVGLLGPENELQRRIVEDIELGIGAGVYEVRSSTAALDLLLGAKVEAMRRIVAGERDPAYAAAMTEMVLRAFGRPASEAALVVKRTAERLERLAPERMTWWPKPVV